MLSNTVPQVTQVTLSDAKEVVVVEYIVDAPGCSDGPCRAQPGRPVPGLPAGGGRRGARCRRRGVGRAVHPRVPRRARPADDRRRREPRLDADRPRPLRRPVRRAAAGARGRPRRRAVRRAAGRDPRTRRRRCAPPRTRPASAHRADFGHSRVVRGPGLVRRPRRRRRALASSARCRSCPPTARCWPSSRSASPIRRCGNCSAARVSACWCTSGSAPRSACWRPGCCPGASSGTPAGWRSPRSPAWPTTGKRCCTASVRAWSR